MVDGVGAAASFNSPTGVAAGNAGELYVVDTGNALVRKIDADGTVSSLSPSGLALPTGIAVNAQNDVFVSDTGHNRIVRIPGDGSPSEVFAGTGGAGNADASDKLQATFAGPRGLAIGSEGELYVADVRNDSIRRVDASGVTTLAGDLGGITAVAADRNGKVYFTTIRSCQLGVVENGAPRVLANQAGAPGFADGAADGARLRSIDGLIAEDDRVVFSDTGSYRVRALSLGDSPDVHTIFGDGRAPLSLDDATRVMLPRGIARYRGGYAVTDPPGNRIVWFRERP
jgi:sugar lactone lactonase YvrE